MQPIFVSFKFSNRVYEFPGLIPFVNLFFVGESCLPVVKHLFKFVQAVAEQDSSFSHTGAV